MEEDDTPNSEEIRLQVSENIRRVRVEQGLSQAKLADYVGCARTQIWVIESGKRMTNISTLVRIARALNVPLKTLLVGVK